MAVTYLNKNATSLAAANWDDATGFAAGAQLIVADGSVATTADVDQNGSDVEYFVVTEGRTGDLGAAGSPVKFEANTPSGARAEYRASGGRFYYSASGTACNKFIANSQGGSVYFEGGTITDLEVARVSYLRANTSTVITNFKIGAGRGVIDGATAGTTAVTSGEIWGGNWTIRRDGTYKICGDATVVFDVLDSSPSTTLTIDSPRATVIVLRGDIATVTHNAGHMSTKGERAISIGASAYIRGPGQIATVSFNDIDTIATPTTWGGQATQIGKVPAF